jgi:DNA-binding NarL/FixJ family response regulator
MSERITLIIADDHPVVRDGLRGMLASQPDFELVGEAEDGSEAVRLAGELRPQVVLIDLRMPRMDGVSAIQAISAKHPEIHLLVLTTYDSDSDILRAIEAGATGYLLKDAPRDELFQAIRSTAMGKSYLSPVVATRLVRQMHRPEETPLSERELDVLRLVAEGASNKEIAHRLHISETTVKTHLLHIFAKLEVGDRTQAVTVAIQRGIVTLQV